MDLRECTLSSYVSSRGPVEFLDPDLLCAGQTDNATPSAAKLGRFRDAVVRSGSVCVLLAAGQGSRFVAETPKVIYPFTDVNQEQRPLAAFSIKAASDCGMPIVVIVGHAREQVVRTLRSAFADDYPILFVVQDEQMGTGHAVYLAKHALPDGFNGDIVVTYADNPGVDAKLLKQLVDQHQSLKQSLGNDYGALILTGSRADAGNGAAAYGRIVRETKQGGCVIDIVEKKTILKLRADDLCKTYSKSSWNANELEDIDEFNSGIVIARADQYLKVLGDTVANQTKFKPPKFEYYATDFVKGLAAIGKVSEGWKIPVDSIWKLEGANTVDELRELEQKSILRAKSGQVE